jgi:hypothetical protein
MIVFLPGLLLGFALIAVVCAVAWWINERYAALGVIT